MTCTDNSKVYDLTIEKNTDFNKTVPWKRNGIPVDLSTITFIGGVAKDLKSSELIASFDFTTVDVTGGTFTFSLPSSATALMEGNAVVNNSQRLVHLGMYTVAWNDGINKDRLLEGKVTLSRGVV
jgi:hypothetical protein